MRHFFSPLLLALGLVLSGTAQAPAQAFSTEWMTSGQYQSYFNSNVSQSGLLITHVEAGEFHGQIYYFASFEPLRPGIGWATHHGLSDASFNQRNRDYQAQGYYLFHQQRFVSSGGRVANQGIWYR